MPSSPALFAALSLVYLPLLHATDPARQVPPNAEMSYLDNGVVKVGVDLAHGGAIVFLSRDGGENLINNFDLGRQVQLSFYSGPVPFSAEGQTPKKHWEHLGWNPIQTGDDFRNPSKILAHENNSHTIHLTCQPMQWPLNNIPGDCTFESWLELDGPIVKARARLNNARTDHTQYKARLQELPALYANAAFPRVVSYIGERPFSGEPVSDAPKPQGKHPWSLWRGTESWAALLNDKNEGVGLITPGQVFFTGGFAGKPGPNDSLANSTGYLAGQNEEILDHNITYEFSYELLPGSLEEIRARATLLRPTALPSWTFSKKRLGWTYRNATDRGWPIQEHLHVLLNQDDPQILSPYTFWRAEDAPFLIIEAAIHAKQKTATVFWQNNDQNGPQKEQHLQFPIQPDGTFHRYAIRLAECPSYRDALTKLRFDPISSGEPDAWVQVRSIQLSKEP